MYIRSCLGKYMSCYRTVVSTTKDQVNTGLARATNPVECVSVSLIYDCILTFETGHRYLYAHMRVGGMSE